MNQQEELMQSLYEYLPKLYGGIQTNIEYYRTNEIGLGDDLLIQVIDGLSWSIDAILLLSCEGELNLNIEQIKELLEQLLEALENNDKVLIADLLEYEILEEIKNWYIAIYDMCDKE